MIHKSFIKQEDFYGLYGKVTAQSKLQEPVCGPSAMGCQEPSYRFLGLVPRKFCKILRNRRDQGRNCKRWLNIGYWNPMGSVQGLCCIHPRMSLNYCNTGFVILLGNKSAVTVVIVANYNIKNFFIYNSRHYLIGSHNSFL